MNSPLAGRVRHLGATVGLLTACGSTTALSVETGGASTGGRAEMGNVMPGSDSPRRDANASPDAQTVALPPCPKVPSAPADRPPGPPVPLATGNDITAIALDDTDVYYASGQGLTGMTTLRAVPKRGGQPREVAPVLAHHLRSAGSFIYAGGGGYGLRRVDKRTGAVESLSADVFDFDLDDTYLYGASLSGEIVRWAQTPFGDFLRLAPGIGAQGISIHDGWAYWADYGADRISRARAQGGAVQILATDQHFPRTVLADCRQIYFSIGNYGEQIKTLPLELVGVPDARPTVFAPIGGAVVLDAVSLYVQNSMGTWRVSLATGAVASLGKGWGPPGFGGLVTGSIAVDDDSLYFTTGDAVFRADK